jgi:hypothetical protein
MNISYEGKPHYALKIWRAGKNFVTVGELTQQNISLYHEPELICVNVLHGYKLAWCGQSHLLCYEALSVSEASTQ